LERTALKCIIKDITGIKKAYLQKVKDKSKEDYWIIQTQGCNFVEIYKQFDNCIDIKDIYCNDINKVLATYGVEAARATIIKEIQIVFSAYGVSSDYRHLSLIADYMTFEGGIRPFNRIGIKTHTSPLLKMSFETTMAFLTEATISGDYDLLNSPASRIVLGKPMDHGTGCFELFYNINS